MEYARRGVLCNLSLLSKEVKRWIELYRILKQKRKEIFYLAKKYYKIVYQAEQELEIFNKSIKSLELCIEKAANRKLNIYNKLNWNTALADFNLLLLDSNLSAISFSPNLDVDNGTRISSQGS